MSPLLLDHVRSLVEAERALTDAIETTTPLLQQNTMSSSILSSQSDPPLLPTPRNIEEVKTILAVARTYSLRTSAPPMWNPNLPVIGFATPNPLPHQLRGGALGAMQLKMAREEKNRKIKEAADNLREKERKEQMEVEEDEHVAAKKESEDAMDIDEASKEGEAKGATPVEGKAVDPKKQEMIVNQKRRMEQVAANGQKKQTSAEMHAKKAAANMNLSDSSSSEEDEGSDSD
mmetsp:Transcript_14215/g.21355  ORF Transcript_14215/g.21355 Transcript_14215/m.21355 type:complete len:232 (-) Transcript_14215:134-829(-)